MSEFVSIAEASKTLGRSRTWVRNRAISMEKEGQALRRDGKWEVNINALCAVRGASREHQKTEQEKTPETEWSKLYETLRAENQDLTAENRQLRAELMALLSSKSNGLSRWFRG